MKRYFLFACICISLSILSCTKSGEAKKRYAQLPSISECVDDPSLGIRTIKELDEIIEQAPHWWEPYHLKIVLYHLIASYSPVDGNDFFANPEREIIRVYETWGKKNSMDIQKNAGYALHLEKLGEQEKATERMRQAWNDFNGMKKRTPRGWQEEAWMVIGVFAGVHLGEVTADNINDYYYVAGREPGIIDVLNDMLNPDAGVEYSWD